MSTGVGGGRVDGPRRYPDTSPDATGENKASLSDGRGGPKAFAKPQSEKGGDSKSRNSTVEGADVKGNSSWNCLRGRCVCVSWEGGGTKVKTPACQVA